MCGIVGYIGREQAAPILLAGLKKLEYRGYDSAGIAVLREGRFVRVRREGSVRDLHAAPKGHIGIGHTRWATHGAPTARNAHPHIYGRFAIVHNGIIENFAALKAECLARGERFSSETDSEVIAHLLAYYDEGDLLRALQKTCARLTGAYAIAALTSNREEIALARKASPLIVARTEHGTFCASDLYAIGEAADFAALRDGEFALLRADEAIFYDARGVRIAKQTARYCPETGDPMMGKFRHFMRKEISEIPAAIAKTAQKFDEMVQNKRFCEVLCQTEYIDIIACGTAYHSGLAAKYVIEQCAGVRCNVTVASEYRYAPPVAGKGTLAVAVSQSGETADTIAAARLARARGVPLLSVTNVAESTLCGCSDFVFKTEAGREIGVAATKSFCAQLIAHDLFALLLAQCKGRPAKPLGDLAGMAEKTLAASEAVARWAPYFLDARAAFFLGRGIDSVVAREGSLKLKEISYLPSEGYPAGELKHGTLALIERGTPVVVILTSRRLAAKTMDAVHEVAARGGRVFLVTPFSDLGEEACARLLIPEAEELFSPVLSVIPLQLLAYHVALAKGADPDRPRNLAKSVTVE